MDIETLRIVSEIAGTLTTAGVLLVWVWAERRDVRRESKRVDALIERMTGADIPEDEIDR